VVNKNYPRGCKKSIAMDTSLRRPFFTAKTLRHLKVMEKYLKPHHKRIEELIVVARSGQPLH
jgi:hypothetical protein